HDAGNGVDGHVGHLERGEVKLDRDLFLHGLEPLLRQEGKEGPWALAFRRQGIAAYDPPQVVDGPLDAAELQESEDDGQLVVKVVADFPERVDKVGLALEPLDLQANLGLVFHHLDHVRRPDDDAHSDQDGDAHHKEREPYLAAVSIAEEKAHVEARKKERRETQERDGDHMDPVNAPRVHDLSIKVLAQTPLV